MTMLQFDLRKTSAPRGWVIACPDGCNNHEAGCPPALGACAPGDDAYADAHRSDARHTTTAAENPSTTPQRRPGQP